MFSSENSQESYAKILEETLSYYLSPLLAGARNFFFYCYEQFPFLSMIGTTSAFILGYIGINRFKTKTRNERESEKERSLSQIPGMRDEVHHIRQDIADARAGFRSDIRRVNDAMLNVTSSALTNANATLNSSNSQREQLDALQRNLTENAQAIRSLDRTIGDISRTVSVLPKHGEKLATLEGLQRSVIEKVEETGGYVRLRQNTN